MNSKTLVFSVTTILSSPLSRLRRIRSRVSSRSATN